MDYKLQNKSAKSISDSKAEGQLVDSVEEQDIPSIEVDNLDALYDMALDYVKGTRLGSFEAYKWPFEIQVESDFKILHKRLLSLFEEADKARRKVFRDALVLRAVTFTGYLIMLIAFWYALDLMVPADGVDGVSFEGFSSTIKFVPILIGIIIVLLVPIFRHGRLEGLKQQASSFGSTFNESLTKINTMANCALENVNNDGATTAGCGERAEKWSFVALWLFQLHQFYDRYVTTSSWRAQTRLMQLTTIFRSAKAVAFVLFVFLMYLRKDWFISNTVLSVIAVAVPLLLLYLAWDAFGKAGTSNNLWARKFLPAVAGTSPEEVQNNHMNIKVSKLIGSIRNLQYQAANNA